MQMCHKDWLCTSGINTLLACSSNTQRWCNALNGQWRCCDVNTLISKSYDSEVKEPIVRYRLGMRWRESLSSSLYSSLFFRSPWLLLHTPLCLTSPLSLFLCNKIHLLPLLTCHTPSCRASPAVLWVRGRWKVSKMKVSVRRVEGNEKWKMWKMMKVREV